MHRGKGEEEGGKNEKIAMYRFSFFKKVNDKSGNMIFYKINFPMRKLHLPFAVSPFLLLHPRCYYYWKIICVAYTARYIPPVGVNGRANLSQE